MPGRVRVRGAVAVRRPVATPNVPAFQTDPQMKPGRSDGEAVLAADHGVRENRELDVGPMAARHRPKDRVSGPRGHHANV